ncbi:hypothetical protein [Fibrivirga algicola]|jgi:hypothetical protein|uniref:Uncharacterized protein n=1 Tax=Fibrivirga algicola TaxID=2950420 RepID=A0ABX0QR27_9BACT|nr:hypothetical protein [Fibrivirga algicola]NID13605.1 hypothetical protein [Fibrivirga algicola]
MLIILLLSGCTNRAVQLLHSANDIASPNGTGWVHAVREKPRQHQVIVVSKPGHKQAVAASSVWGYRTRHNELYRLYQDTFYEVLQRGPLTVYCLDEWAGDAHWLSFYFSLTPNGDIYDLDQRTTKAYFKDDECMQRLLSQMRERHILRTDGHGSYGLANAYSFCHCRDTPKR